MAYGQGYAGDPRGREAAVEARQGRDDFGRERIEYEVDPRSEGKVGGHWSSERSRWVGGTSPKKVSPEESFSAQPTAVVAPVSNVTNYLEDITPAQTAKTDVEKAIFGKGFGPLPLNKDMVLSFRDRNPEHRRNKAYAEKFMGGGPQAIQESAAASVPMGPHRRAPMGDVSGDPSTYQYTPMTYDERNLAQQAALEEQGQKWRNPLDIKFNMPKLSDWITFNPYQPASPSARTNQIRKTARGYNPQLNTETSLREKIGMAPWPGKRLSNRSALEAKRQLAKYGPRFEAKYNELSDKMKDLSRQAISLQQDTALSNENQSWSRNTKDVFDYFANPRYEEELDVAAIPPAKDLPGSPPSAGYPKSSQWQPENLSPSYYVPEGDKAEYNRLRDEMSAIRPDMTRMFKSSWNKEAGSPYMAPLHENPFYDAMRHGFLANQVSLPVAQGIEFFESGGQASDFYNNPIANRFFRPDFRPEDMFGPRKFDAETAAHMQNILGPPASPSSRVGDPMDAWAELQFRETMNPGSTGYSLNTNVADQGIRGIPMSSWLNWLRNADWTGKSAEKDRLEALLSTGQNTGG